MTSTGPKGPSCPSTLDGVSVKGESDAVSRRVAHVAFNRGSWMCGGIRGWKAADTSSGKIPVGRGNKRRDLEFTRQFVNFDLHPP